MFGKDYNAIDRMKLSEINKSIFKLASFCSSAQLGKIEKGLSLSSLKATKETIIVDDALLSTLNKTSQQNLDAGDFESFFDIILELLFYRQTSYQKFDSKAFKQQKEIWDKETEASLLAIECDRLENEILELSNKKDDALNQNKIKIKKETLNSKKASLNNILFLIYDKEKINLLNKEIKEDQDFNKSVDSISKSKKLLKKLRKERLKADITKYNKEKEYKDFNDKMGD